MKRKFALIAGLCGIFFALMGVGVAHAQTFTMNVPKDKVIDGSVYSVGRNVNIEGVINGDVYCLGQNIFINATVHGDILCTGQNVAINGHIDGNVRAIGGSVDLKATIDGSASVGGIGTKIERETKIGRDLSMFGTTADVSGTIGRDVSTAVKTTRLQATIGRDVVMNGTTLTLKDVHIQRDLRYTSVDSIKKVGDVKIDGETKHSTPPVNKKGHIAFLGTFSLLLFPMMFVFSMVLALLFPQTINNIVKIPSKKLFRTIFAGFLWMAAMPILLFLLVASVIGVGVAIFVVIVWLLLGMLSGPVAAFYLGNMILSRSRNALLMMLVGTLVLLVLYILPQIGIAVAILAYMLGSGSIVLYVKRNFKKQKYEVS